MKSQNGAPGLAVAWQIAQLAQLAFLVERRKMKPLIVDVNFHVARRVQIVHYVAHVLVNSNGPLRQLWAGACHESVCVCVHARASVCVNARGGC
jgi:hypothetical protein